MSEVMFGLSIPPSVLPGTDPVASARMAEDLGFDFVSASDHPCGTEPAYETWTMLSWVAAGARPVDLMGGALVGWMYGCSGGVRGSRE